MVSNRTFRAFAMTTLFLFSFSLLPVVLTHAQFTPAEPWTSVQTVQPADLAKELESGKFAPTVLFVGFQRLYSSGHIKGAQFHGSGGSAEGLAEIRKWAGTLPRTTNVVIYCGCCPMNHCPNVRPAFKAMQEMGFTKLRVLILPNDFAIDWAGKGLPYDKGQ